MSTIVASGASGRRPDPLLLAPLHALAALSDLPAITVTEASAAAVLANRPAASGQAVFA